MKNEFGTTPVILFDAAVDFANENTSDISIRDNLRMAFVAGAEWQWRRVDDTVDEVERLREALEKIASTNQIREFMGNDKNDGYGDGGWVVRDGQYAKLARAALKEQE